MNNTSRTSVRTLVMLALLVAMSIVFSRVLSISTGFVRFNLGSLPVLLAALLFGPGAGFAVGAVADIIGGVLAGYAINPLITLGAGAIGLDVLFISIVLPFRLKGTSRADAKRPPCATNRTKEGVNPTNFTSGQGGRPSRLHPSPCSSGMQILYRGYTFVHSTTPR